MKKLLMGFMALAMGLVMVSCGQKADQPANGGEENGKQPTLSELVEKAKAEGANWTVDEWKENFKNVMLCVKPMMLKMKEMTEVMEKDPAKAAEMLAELENDNEMKSLDSLMNAFEDAAKATENGKAVADDEEWGKQLLEELGLPTDL